MDEHQLTIIPGSHTPYADLDMLLNESDYAWTSLATVEDDAERPDTVDAMNAQILVGPRQARSAAALEAVCARAPARVARRRRGPADALLAGEQRAPHAQRRQPVGARREQAARPRSMAPSRRGSPAARRQSRAPSPAAAAASARISGSSRSKPPQNASREAASTNGPPRPCSAAYAATRIAAGASLGKRSGHTSGSRSVAARRSAAARTSSTLRRRGEAAPLQRPADAGVQSRAGTRDRRAQRRDR